MFRMIGNWLEDLSYDWQSTLAGLLIWLVLLGTLGGLAWLAVTSYQMTHWVARCVVAHPEMVQAKAYCESLWYTGGGR